MTALAEPPRRLRKPPQALARQAGVGWVLLAEAVANAIGFVALIHLTGRLGPEGFGRLEFAAAVSAWLLVLVRGGVDVVVYREAARRPRLVGRLTNLLLGFRAAAAVGGCLVAAAFALLSGHAGGALVCVASVSLLASAGVTDVGARASGRYGLLAAGQVVRGVGYCGAVLGLVRGPGDGVLAALALVVCEMLAAVLFGVVHVSEWGVPRLAFRKRASLVLVRRGLLAGLTRFGRVTLYSADLLALGALAGPDVGTYAAARRLLFALLGLGLVVPGALGPAFARAWAAGAADARRAVTSAAVAVAAVSVPASLGLAFTAGRWMPALFGPSYQDGGPLLGLLALRLPLLLAAGLVQAALLACRREPQALRHVGASAVVTLVLVPAGLVAGGIRGLAWGTLGAEAAGAALGLAALARLGLIGAVREEVARVGLACLGLALGCRFAWGLPLPLTCLAGVIGYAVVWLVAGRKGGPCHKV